MISIMNHSHRGGQRRQSSEVGFVAIFVTIIIMMVLTLIVIGFTKLARQEQRRTLDRQLNTQAFYAAEAGINDAITGIKNNNITTNLTTCQNALNASSWATPVDAGLGVEYTCVLVYLQVTDIKKDNVPVSGREQAFIMPLEVDPSSPGPLRDLEIEWDSPTGSILPSAAISPSDPKLPTTTDWGANTLGALRFDITPTDAGSNLDRADMVNDTLTFYILPQQNSGSFTGRPVSPSKGEIIVAECDDPDPDTYRCATTVRLAPPSSDSYVMRVTSLYNATRLWVKPLSPSGGSVVLRNGQAIIDSTGKAGDVFRRIQERVPINSQYSTYESPTFVIQNGNDICKRLRVFPGMTTSPDTDCAGGIN